MYKVTFVIQRLVGLRHNVIILYVGGHILDFLRNAAGRLIHAAERRLNKAVLVDARKGSQVRNQTDVRTFRRFNWAHAAVVAVVNVADFESGAVTGQTAGAERGQTALMRELCERVILIHELRQRGGTEEFLDRRHNRTDINERMGRQNLEILRLQGHSLADDALQTGEADAKLVLQQLTDRTDAAVAQMVDIVGVAEAHRQAVHIVDRRENIVDDNVLRYQLVSAGAQNFL